jgi:hypothetical protein
MSTEFQLVEIPERLLPIIGEADPGTRIFRQAGTKKECGRWFDALCEYINGTVSPGGVNMYVKVSRAATYKRIKEGRLTAFCFHEVEKQKRLFGGVKEVRTSPYIYVPVSEAKSWGQELEARLNAGEKLYREDIEGEEPDFKGEFFEWDSKWRKKRLEEFRGKPLR